MSRSGRFSCASLAATVFVVTVAPPTGAGRSACPARTERVADGTWETRGIEEIEGARFQWVLAADERDPGLVVVGDARGILVTRDGGCTWERSVEYAQYLAPFLGSALDAVVAGGRSDRSLHVLVAPWQAFVPNGPPKLFSSFDDGATWSVADVPPAAGPASTASLSLTASPAAARRVYLLAHHAGGVGVVYSGSGDAGSWRWQSLTVPSAPEGCVPGATCLSRPLRELHADPARRGALWALTSAGPLDSETLGFSRDEGVTWEPRPVPALTGGAALVDVSSARGGTIVVVSDFWEYALSRDGGRSWAVGDYPQVTSSTSRSVEVFDVAHFDGGRATAVLPGAGPTSGWAGNVFVFDGRKWVEAAPRGYAGYDRSDDDGDPLSFAGLASTDGPLVALSARGELMTFRR